MWSSEPFSPISQPSAGVAWVPTNLGANLIALYTDPDLNAYAGGSHPADGAAAPEWRDTSGNGYHTANLGGHGSAPIYRASAAPNGRPGLLFTASNGCCLDTNTYASNTQVVALGTGTVGSMWAVVTANGASIGSNGRLAGYVGNGDSADTGSVGGAAWILRDGINDNVSTYRGGFLALKPMPFNNTTHLILSVFTGTTHAIYVDGSISGSTPASSSSWTSPGDILISAEAANAVNAPWDGYIHEIGVSNINLALANLTNLTSWAQTHWGTP